MALRTRFKRAVKAFREIAPAIGDSEKDSHLWRKLSRAPTKDLEPWAQEKMLRMVYFLWIQNPMARGIIELKKDYVVGDGLSYTAEDEKVKEALDRFWNDPVNNWRTKIHRKVRELILYGEQIWPAFVQDHTGRLRLGYVDPLNVKKVVVDPLNVEVPIGVILKSGHGIRDIRLRTVLPGLDYEQDLSGPAIAEREKFIDGETFYFAINKLSNATRGISDILPIVDILDAYDRLQFTRAEKVEISGRYFFDCLVKGASEEEIKEFQKSDAGQLPKDGSTKYHNESVEWNTVAPDLKAQDFDHDMKRLKNYILAGVGLPEHFFGEGGDVNRATALEMGTPVNKRLRSLQDEVEAIFEVLFREVIHLGKVAGTIPSGADETFVVTFPELDVKDLVKHADAFGKTVTALGSALMDEVISVEEYREMMKKLVDPFGVELTDDIDELEKKVKDKADESDIAPYRKTAVSRTPAPAFSTS